jgi:acetyltransferase-like isoleucine patch superfamily enzyme
LEGLNSGTYHLRTANIIGLGDLLRGDPADISCTPFCDPLTGEDIVVGINVSLDIDFDLATTPVITGHVSKDDPVVNAEGVRVDAYNGIGVKVATAVTDGDGNFTLANLWQGGFYVRTANILGYVDALHADGQCTGECDVKDGTQILVPVTGSVALPDMQLDDAASISGTVGDGDNGIAGISMELYRDTGAFVAATTTNGAGTYDLQGLTAGDYHLVSRNSFGYIDEGDDNIVCQATCLASSTAGFTIAGTGNTTKDFVLDWGGEISGTVSGGGPGLSGVTVEAYNGNEVKISSTVTGGSGNYHIIGLVAGDVFLRTRNAAPFRNQLYGGGECDAFCDVGSALEIGVVLGSPATGKDFNLISGFAISGVVTDGTDGIGGVLVEAWDGNLPAGSAVSLPPDGVYAIKGLKDLPEGVDYHMQTSNDASFIDIVLGGDSCTPYPCDRSSGTITTIQGADVVDVDILLAPGSTLPGIATVDLDPGDATSVDVPLPTGEAWLYSDTGLLVKTATVADGLFNFTGLADGDYYLVIHNDLGLVDQLWAGIPCPGASCDFVLEGGTLITVGAAAAPEGSTGSRIESTARSTTKALTAGETRYQFILEDGTPISGSITIDGDGPVPEGTNVYIFFEDGTLVDGEPVLTNGLGDFVTKTGFAPGTTWFAATQAPGKPGAGNGLVDEVYNNIPCDGDCDPLALNATGIPIPATGDPSPVYIVLATGGGISGVVNALDAPFGSIAQVSLELFDDAGNSIATASTNGLGEYSFEGLLANTYRLLAKPQAGNFGAVLYDGVYCDGGCDILSGNQVVLNTSTPSATGVDFALPYDNCPNVDNPDQQDSDGDGRGDACEGAPPNISNKATVDETAIIGDGVQIDRNVSVAAHADIGAGSILKRYTRIGESCILGDNVFIGQNAVLGAGCSIGSDSYLNRGVVLKVNVTIGSEAIIGKDSRIDDGAVLGSGVTLGQNVHVMAGSCIPDGASFNKDDVVVGNFCP